jgi:glycosyltransferase involved in cell wall biosynthesis
MRGGRAGQSLGRRVGEASEIARAPQAANFSGAMGSPVVSVLLPVRDAAASLADAIESIRGQTYADWELLIVDDGSRDSSWAIAERAASLDSRQRIHVVRQPALGLVPALTAGLALARGRFIARMDADDVSHSDRLALQLELLLSRPDIGVASGLVAFGGEGQAGQGYAEHVRWLNTVVTPEALALSRFIESPLAHPSVLFRRELVERHGGYRAGDFPEDYELWLRWFDAGVCFAKVERELLIWSDSSRRLSRTDPRYAPEAFYAIKCRWLGRHLARTLEPGRPVWLWGAGRITRQRFRSLEADWRSFAGFIDIDPKKVGGSIGGRPVVSPDRIPPRAFVLVGVGNRGARAEIVAHLRSERRQEGEDFLCVA